MRGLGATIVTVAALAACGAPAVLDGPKAEAAIGERLSSTYGVDVGRVTCPADVEVADGGTFTCEVAVGQASTVSVAVRQTDGDGTLVVEPDRAILSTPEIEDDIATTLADRFERDDVEVTCEGEAVRAEAPDATFACEAVDGEEVKQVEVRVRDARGALAYTLLDDE